MKRSLHENDTDEAKRKKKSPIILSKCSEKKAKSGNLLSYFSSSSLQGSSASAGVKSNASFRDELEDIAALLELASSPAPSPVKKKSKISTDYSNNKLNENRVSLPNYLYVVDQFKQNESSNCLEIELSNYLDKTHVATCYLEDSWVSTIVEINDIVHVLADKDCDGSYKINDANGYIIVNPHYILSGTTVLSSLSCLRRSALAWSFKETGMGSNQAMVLGNILHTLFQLSISNRKYVKSELNDMIIDLLKRKQIIQQMFESNINEEYVLKETALYLSSIEKWLQENVAKHPLGTAATNQKTNSIYNSNSKKNFQILNVCDIEESIWSPMYGVKGKLDLTLQVEIKQSAFKSLSSSNNCNSSNSSVSSNLIIPVELKSGRTTFSVEHEGQVILYSLLNNEKRKTGDFGLLLYLKDMNMKFIKVNTNSLRGLLQLRNELVYYLNKSKLPELKNDQRFCLKCPHLTVCSLFNDKSNDTNYINDQYLNERNLPLYFEAVKHLSNNHKKYFFKWFKMLEFEFSDYKQFDAGKMIWWHTKEHLESTGFSVFNLKLVENAKKQPNQKIDYDGEGFFTFDFQKNSNECFNLNLKENDMILLSSQSENLIGISQGFIKSIKDNKKFFTLSVDKNLDGASYKNIKQGLFRIDKINYRSSISLNYTNLGRLMTPDDEICSRLRSFIIDKKVPEFETALPKQIVLSNKSLFKTLNQSQQSAIIKALMAKEYLLIKGYPGTGKTTTIATLIAILTRLEKSVLFTSFTNSAVDNLLLKIIKDFSSIDFVRIGSFDRIHQDIQKYESSYLTANLKTVEELQSFYENKKFIATTCSSINHVVFTKKKFDYCIMDEASQVLLTTCLGPLFTSKKFVLVGDLEQLPPIIKSKEARQMGMGVSLFEWLDCPQSSVELVHQYRMNNEIMNLANEMTYDHKLKCLSESVQNSIIRMDESFMSNLESVKLKKIFSDSVIFIDTSEIIKSLGINISDDQPSSKSNDETNEFRTVNPIEVKIILYLCKIFNLKSNCKKSDEIGVIAPYNNQVKEIQQKLEGSSTAPKGIEVNTVDQFQGRDKRLIIMSFTNSLFKKEETKEMEILNDKRRLTVAITRSKEKLIMIGCIKNLVRYKPLSQMILILKEKESIVNLDSLDELS